MENSFIDLGVSPPILEALEDMGFSTPTEVQSRSIPHILNQEDLIVMSKTGSGKTAVYGVSILQMTEPGAIAPQALILTPTRELAVQVDSDLKKMSAHLQHRTVAVYGQHSINAEIQALEKGASIVTGTPGRVYDHIRRGNLVTRDVRFMVLDEADRMLDMGFIDQVLKIIRTVPKNRITLLFSATIPPEIRRICRDYMKDPIMIEIESPTKTVDTIKQVYYRVNHNEKRIQLNRLLLIEQPESCIIFCNTRHGVDQVQSFLTRKGYASESLHGDIPQAKRLKTMQQFKNGEFHLLVATDVAARGIHIDDLSLVINYDIPMEKDSYIHRIGRTGRAGNGGLAISLVTSDDIMTLYEIEEHIGALITESELPSEEAYEQRRESAERWIQANALKGNAPQASQIASSIKQKNPRQQGSKKPYSYQNRPGNRLPADNMNLKASEGIPAPQNPRQGQPVSRPGQLPRPGQDTRPRQTTRSGQTAGQAQSNRPAQAARPGQSARPEQNRTGTRSGSPTGTSQSARSSQPSRSAQGPGMNQAARAGQSTRPNPSRQKGSGLVQQNTKAIQNPASSVKKPFLKRMIQRILGR